MSYATDDTINEEWRPVVGYEDAYEVSSIGRVRSLERITATRNGQTRYVRPIIRKLNYNKGYPIVDLKVNGQRETCQVHVLILTAFVGPRPEKFEACHNDGNPKNNKLDNLRWGTVSSNAYDRVRHGTHHWANKVICPRGHLLIEGNLVLATARTGRRECLACHSRYSKITHRILIAAQQALGVSRAQYRMEYGSSRKTAMRIMLSYGMEVDKIMSEWELELINAEKFGDEHILIEVSKYLGLELDEYMLYHGDSQETAARILSQSPSHLSGAN